MLDLNSLIAPGSGFTMETAYGITDNGFIAGYGIDSNGDTRAFLLTAIAVPEPSTVLLISVTVVAAGLLWWKRCRNTVVADRSWS